MGSHRLPAILALLAWLATLAAALPPLPQLDALEALASGELLGVSRASSQLLLLRIARGDSALGTYDCRVVAGPGPGPGALERPGEADARLGLQVLVLDAGRRSVSQYSRELAWQGREELPTADELPSPELLAVSAGRTLIVGSPRGGSLVVRRPGEDWQPLLDFTRAGLLRPVALEAVGERVFVLDRAGPPRLLLCGTEGGWLERWAAPGLEAIHRDGEHDLLLLFRRGGALELERWPAALTLARLPASRRLPAGRYPLDACPEQGSIRDFLLLPGQGEEPAALLLARSGAPALLLAPLDGPPR